MARAVVSQRGLEADEQDEEQRDPPADAAHEPPEQAALQTPGATLGIGGRVGIGQSQFAFHGGSGRRVAGCWGGTQKLPIPTELFESSPKILKKAKITAGAAAMIAPPMMDILP